MAKVKKKKIMDRGILNYIKRLWIASKAGRDERGYGESENFKKMKSSALNELDIESSVYKTFSEKVGELLNGKIDSFTITIKKEAYSYFTIMSKRKEFSNLIIEQLDTLTYKVVLNENNIEDD